MPHADTGDVVLFYTDDGPRDAAALLLVHGFGADSDDWVFHIAELAKSYRVIAPDLRGHGHSGAPESGYAPQDFAADLVALLDTLGVDRVVAVGHSMGGMIVSALAVEHPERVRALVCVDAGYGKPDELGPYLVKLAGQMAADPYGVALANDQWCYNDASPAYLRTWHARKILATPAHVLPQAFSAMWRGWGVRAASTAYLAGRSCPVLAFSFDPGQSAWESSLGSETVTWPDAAHRLHAERPAEFLTAVTNWLTKLDS